MSPPSPLTIRHAPPITMNTIRCHCLASSCTNIHQRSSSSKSSEVTSQETGACNSSRTENRSIRGGLSHRTQRDWIPLQHKSSEYCCPRFLSARSGPQSRRTGEVLLASLAGIQPDLPTFDSSVVGPQCLGSVTPPSEAVAGVQPGQQK